MKKTVKDIIAMKGREKISVLTCYDYSFAKALDGQVDIILVGDSLGNVILGYKGTKNVTMEDMLRHVGAVSRGAPNTMIIADLPIGSYDNKERALKNSRRLIEAGADGVKPEGKADIVRYLSENKINVMAHLGLLPQSAEKFGVVGRDTNEAKGVLEQAELIERAGAFSLILECVPSKLAQEITKSIKIPTIGIGAGKECDGQVLVLYDLIGLYPDFEPRFVRKYMNLKEDISRAVQNFSTDVKKGRFPNVEESFK